MTNNVTRQALTGQSTSLDQWHFPAGDTPTVLVKHNPTRPRIVVTVLRVAIIQTMICISALLVLLCLSAALFSNTVVESPTGA